MLLDWRLSFIEFDLVTAKRNCHPFREREVSLLSQSFPRSHSSLYTTFGPKILFFNSHQIPCLRFRCTSNRNILHELVPADMIKLQTASDWKKVTSF